MSKALVGLLVLGLLGAVAGPGCGTDPVAVDGCRAIEDARCEQAPSCPNLKVSDVDACKRFYRDQCLHGLTTTTDPGEPNINRCVDAIKLAGQCKAADNGCVATIPTAKVESGCQVVEHPEWAVDCAFLNPPSSAGGGPTLVAGSSGASGSAGSAGASGAAGAGGDPNAAGAAGGGAAGAGGAAGTTAGAGGAGM